MRGRGKEGARCAVSPVHDRETSFRKLSEEDRSARAGVPTARTDPRCRKAPRARAPNPDDSASFPDSLCPVHHRVSQFNLMRDSRQYKHRPSAVLRRVGWRGRATTGMRRAAGGCAADAESLRERARRPSAVRRRVGWRGRASTGTAFAPNAYGLRAERVLAHSCMHLSEPVGLLWNRTPGAASLTRLGAPAYIVT